jgi:hypothetical protein
MYESFTLASDPSPYTALPARIDLNTKNPATAFGARASLELDFSDYDRLTIEDEDTLNRVLWHSIKGENVPYPPPVRRGLFDRSGRALGAPAGLEDENRSPR